MDTGHSTADWRGLLGAALLLVFTTGCSDGGSGTAAPVAPSTPPVSLRVYHSPYGGVDWATDLRLKTQHHDHPGLIQARIKAYDDAGYDAIIPADYSGAPDKSYALKSRLWPPESVLPPTFLASLRNIKFFIPGAEEVGFSDHFTSPFLTEYVERWLAGYSAQKTSFQFTSTAEMIEMIKARGGMVFFAHPWVPNVSIDQLDGLAGTEIYSAFAEAMRRAGVADYTTVDRNALLVENWDRALAVNQALIGLAVNDHFGPLPDKPTDADVKDSGKTIVLTKAATLAAYRDALERGSVLAVRDMGVPKDRLPVIRSVNAGTSSISVDTDGSVRWVARGTVIGNAAVLEYRVLPPGSTYLRAEIENADRTVTIFSQAFWVRPVGDADGDRDVDVADQQICANVRAGSEKDPDRVAACQSS